MARTDLPYVAFNGGEVGAQMHARFDVPAIYQKACKTLENFIPTPQGPATKRMGTQFVQEVKDSSFISYLVPFIFSEIDSFIIEFGNNYIRFYTGRAPVLEPPVAITNATQTNPVTITAPAHGFVNGDQVYINNVVGMTQLNGKRFTVTNSAVNTFDLLGIDGTGYSAYISGGVVARVYTISSPYSSAQVRQLKYAQIGDIMYLAHPDVLPQKLSRFGLTNWIIAPMLNVRGPVLDRPEDQIITLTASATTGVITVTASAPLFQPGHVDSLWEIRDAAGTFASRGFFRILTYTSPTVVTADVETGPLFGITPTTYWFEAAWSGVKGYPRAVAFHESRLLWGGMAANPLMIIGSVSNQSYETYDLGTGLDTDGLQFILSGRINSIQWLLSDTNFLVSGTFGGLAFIGSGSSTEPLTATNFSAKNGTTTGSSFVQGLRVANSLKYLQKSTTKLMDAKYDDLTLNYEAGEITIVNNDILRPSIFQIAVQQEKYDTMFMVRSDGQMVGLVLEGSQNVKGFYRMVTGRRAPGISGHDDTVDKFESVAVIPGVMYDEIWVVVQRQVNGQLRRYIEYVEPDETIEFFVDSGATYDGRVGTNLTLSSAAVGIGVTFTSATPAFAATDVGRQIYGWIYLPDGTREIGRATITAFTSTTVVTVTITVAFSSVNIAASNWALTSTSISGLDHLEGEIVSINSDGSNAGNVTVINGTATITSADNRGILIHVGRPYNADMQPLFIEGGQQTGSSQGKKKRIHELCLTLYKTMGLKVGRDFDNLEELPFRTAPMLMDLPPPLFGNDWPEDYEPKAFNGNWSTQASVCIRSDYPKPATIIGLYPRFVTNDKP